MMKHLCIPAVAALLALTSCASVRNSYSSSDNVSTTVQSDCYVVVTRTVPVNGGGDVADLIQEVINNNPNRTLFFPDGVYLLSHPVLTPADPAKSVHLVFANYAVLKAMDGWKEGEALVKLGGKDPFNSITINGSNYGIEGGIFDGSNVADGISIDSGRETRVNHVSIKNTRVGLHIKRGANNGSSDCDIVDVNIVGNNRPNSVGVLVEGYDNTFTDMRIASVNKGVWIKTGGNTLRNIHPLYIFNKEQDYDSSCAFIVEGDSNNWLNCCYSDQFATGFLLERGAAVNMRDCFAMWYSGKVPSQTAIRSTGAFNAQVTGMHFGFLDECPKIAILVSEPGGRGFILDPLDFAPHSSSDEDVSSMYMVFTNPSAGK